MDESILNTVKKIVGFEADDTDFDMDFIIHINTVFSILHQLGASPPEGFFITGKDETWGQFLENRMHVEMVKTYVALKVRLILDPPATSFGIKAVEDQIHELEARLSYMELTFNPNAYGNAPLIVVEEVVPQAVTAPFMIYTTESTNG